MAKQENKVTLQMVDSGGPEAALHIYIDGDYTQGAGRLAACMLIEVALRFADRGDTGFGQSFPEEVKLMIAHHLGNNDDTQEIESILGVDKGREN